MMLLDKVNRLMRASLVVQRGRALVRDVGGRAMHWYELEGRSGKPAAVLVHGLGGNANNFFPILSALRRSYSRLFVPDLPGHGFTPLSPGESPRDLDGHYEALTAFLDEVVREPAVMIGNSLGGALSLQVGIDRPSTPALGLLSPAGAPLGEEGLESLKRVFTLPSRTDAVRMVERMLHRRPLAAWLVARDLIETFDTPVVHHVLEHTTAVAAIDAGKMRALPMPVTLVWGASERILPADGVDYFRRHLPPHARVEVLDRCSHVPMLERPLRTAALLAGLAREAEAFRSSRASGALA